MKIKNIECCPHRRPDRHWTRRDTRMALRCVIEFLGMAVAFLALVAVGEAVCAALGCPADAWAVR